MQKVQCGNSFCLAQTLSNHIYFWGVREIETKRERTFEGPSCENQTKEESSAYHPSDVIKIGKYLFLQTLNSSHFALLKG